MDENNELTVETSINEDEQNENNAVTNEENQNTGNEVTEPAGENNGLDELENAEAIETSVNEDNQNIIFKCEFSEQPVEQYKYAEIRYGRIVSIHRHFMPLAMFKRLFVLDREEDFVDILPAEAAAGFEAQIGDYVFHTDDGTFKIMRPVYPDTVDGAQKFKLDELKGHRDEEETEIIYVANPLDAEQENPVLYGFDYDSKARERINAAIIALDLMGAEVTIDWTLADNTSIPVTAAFLRYVIAKVAERSTALHIKYRTLKESIQQIVENMELTDEEKVAQIKEVTW